MVTRPAPGPGPIRRPGPPEGEVSVFVVDEQSDVAIDLGATVTLAEGVLEAEGVTGECELALTFVEIETIAELNKRFLGHDGPTDVLAFPLDDDPSDPGRSPDASTTGPDRPVSETGEIPVLLGDVIICPAVASRNAGENGRSVADEIALLVVHGVLHVLGMDHAEPDDAAVMQQRERDLLSRFYKPPPSV